MIDASNTAQQAAAAELFFARHLPDVGYRCIARLYSGKFSPTFQAENKGAAAQAVALDGSGYGEVYFGCATYADPNLGRKGNNVLAVRSSWADLDTREWKPDAPYADKQEAKLALAKFCCEVGLATPTLIDSGYGLHVYWPFDRDLAPHEWIYAANLFKQAASKANFQVDPSRTTDIASVLRVPGTANRKNPENPRPVRLVCIGEPIDHDQHVTALIDYVGVEAKFSQQMLYDPDLGCNLTVGSDFPPSDAHLIAERCQVFRHIRDTGGNVPEPLWHAALGVLVHTKQGDDVCHEWSRGHPKYDFVETQSKIDRVRAYGPTTCSRLDSLSGGLCLGCSYREDA